MKKMMALALAMTMTAAMGTGAMAATVSKGDQNIDVQAKYVNSTTSSEVYSVDVTWGAMEFTYTESGAMVWNPENHTYTDNTEAGWSAVGNTVTVTNHSNAPVDAAFGFAALEEYSALTGSFDVETDTLEAGAVGGYDSADSVTAALTLDGELSDTVTDFTKVGTITVTIK